jgi:redox-sensitive bicupin YhaK (pirin superfamily)
MSTNTKTLVFHDSNSRGHTKISWLDSYHTFSFGSFYDPNYMGFRSLRVINDDTVVPGAGFGTHGHRDMEILTYVLSGALEHKDSIGTGSVIRPGDAQIMSAGTGITHSEYNHSQTEPVHFLQIWMLPNQLGLAPRYEQKTFLPEQKRGKLRLIAAKDGRDGAVTVHQDLDLYASILEKGDVVNYQVKGDRYAWLHVAQGVATVNAKELKAGDGVQISGEEKLEISTNASAEILLFDLA